MSATAKARYTLEISADADPVVLIKLIERIQSLNLRPEQLTVTWDLPDHCAIAFAFSGVDVTQAELLCRRLEQWPTVRSTGVREILCGVK